jgi:hypothetical protein
MELMVSFEMVACFRALTTSTIGVSPVTVIVSSSRADLHFRIDLGSKGARQLDARPLHELNPDSLKVTT